MSNSEATRQSDNIQPPIRGQIYVQTVDTTARIYDLSTIKLGSTFLANPQDWMYLSIKAEGGDVYLSFSATTQAADIDDTNTVAAGGAPALTNPAAWRIVKDTTEPYRIHRTLHRYLQLKAAAGAVNVKARIYVSSQVSASSSGA